MRLTADFLNKPSPKANVERVSAHFEATRYFTKEEGVTSAHFDSICLFAGWDPSSVRLTVLRAKSEGRRLVRRSDFASVSC